MASRAAFDVVPPVSARGVAGPSDRGVGGADGLACTLDAPVVCLLEGGSSGNSSRSIYLFLDGIFLNSLMGGWVAGWSSGGAVSAGRVLTMTSGERVFDS